MIWECQEIASGSWQYGLGLSGILECLKQITCMIEAFSLVIGIKNAA